VPLINDIIGDQNQRYKNEREQNAVSLKFSFNFIVPYFQNALLFFYDWQMFNEQK